MRRSISFWIVSLLILIALAILTAGSWLPFFGTFFVISHPLQPADAIIVLAGDGSGRRVLKAGELVREGIAPVALVSGPVQIYQQNEADLAIAQAVRQGFPPSYFKAVISESDSTREEAMNFRTVLQKMGFHKVLLVTSDFHTRRALHTFVAVIPEVEFRIAAAPVQNFDPARWWISRPGRKLVFFEWLKTIADRLGV